MPSSYNGWPASQDPSAIGIDRRFEPLPGVRFPGGVKAGDVSTVIAELVRRLDAEVEPAELYTAGDEWGYHYKQSANSPSLLSCHSSGTAIDYNATRHPNRVRGTWTAAQVTKIRRIVADLSVIRWLGDTSGTPDEMHFEIRGTPAQVAAVAARLRNNPEELTMAQIDDLIARIDRLEKKVDGITGAVLTNIAELREFDEDVPENLAAQQSEVIRTVRALAAAAGVTVPPPNPAP